MKRRFIFTGTSPFECVGAPWFFRQIITRLAPGCGHVSVAFEHRGLWAVVDPHGEGIDVEIMSEPALEMMVGDLGARVLEIDAPEELRWAFPRHAFTCAEFAAHAAGLGRRWLLPRTPFHVYRELKALGAREL